MAQKFTVPISIRQLASAASQGLSIRLDGETEDRIRIEAGGKILWSDGTTATGTDVNLYRGDGNLLKTDDLFQALAGLVTVTTDGVPTAALPDGAIAVDTTNDTLYIRSGGEWVLSSGGAGGTSVTISTTPPLDPNEGDLWFKSDTEQTFIRYDGGWIEIGAVGSVVAAGQEGYVQFNSNGSLAASAGLYWDNLNGRLGVGTTEPVSTLHVNGTATATAFSGPLTGDVTGNADTATALETGRTIELGGDLAGSVVFDGTSNVTLNASLVAETTDLDSLSDVAVVSPLGGQSLKYDSVESEWVNSYVDLGTDTQGDYVKSVTGGVGVTVYDGTGEGASVGIEIGQDVSTTADVIFNTVTADLVGNADTATQLETARTIELAGDILGSTVFDGSSNVTINASLVPEIIAVNDLSDATVASPVTGQFLKYDGTASTWVNDYVNLGTDTQGDYVQSVTGGTGVTVFNGSGEGASVSIEIGQDVSTTAAVIFNTVTADLIGNADSASQLEVGRTIELTGDVLGSTVFDGSSNVAINASLVPEIIPLNDLSDVTVVTPSDGQFLKYDGPSSSWVNDAIDLGTDTQGDYIKSITAGVGVTVYEGTGEGASAGISIGQDVSTTANVTFNDLVVSGNLTVQGISTTLQTETVQVEDNIIVLNYGQTSPVLNGGIEIERGSSTNASIIWDESSDKWTFFDGTTAYDFVRELNDISNVTIGTTYNGQFLGYNSSTQQWENLYVSLGDSTTGNYVHSVEAGTGVTVFGGTGEGASATISIGQDVSTNASVVFETVHATSGVTTLTTSGIPTQNAPDGTLAVDTLNGVLYIRSSDEWVQSSGSGSSVSVADIPPASPTNGDLWFDSDSGSLFVYFYDGDSGQWVEPGATMTGGSSTIDGISSAILDLDGGSVLDPELFEAEVSNLVTVLYDGGIL